MRRFKLEPGMLHSESAGINRHVVGDEARTQTLLQKGRPFIMCGMPRQKHSALILLTDLFMVSGFFVASILVFVGAATICSTALNLRPKGGG
jgi:hypothetical protein